MSNETENKELNEDVAKDNKTKKSKVKLSGMDVVKKVIAIFAILGMIIPTCGSLIYYIIAAQ